MDPKIQYFFAIQFFSYKIVVKINKELGNVLIYSF